MLMFLYWIETGSGIDRVFPVVFSMFSFLFGVNFIILSFNWKKSIRKWSAAEERFNTFPYTKLTTNYRLTFTKITVCNIFIIILFDTKWLLQSSVTKNLYERDNSCFLKHENFFKSIWTYQNKPHIFRFVTYQPLMSLVSLVRKLLNDICWGLANNFCVLVSYWLEIRLKQLKDRIEKTKLSESHKNWKEIFEDFECLANLIKSVDRKLGKFFTLLSTMWLVRLCYFLYKLIR